MHWCSLQHNWQNSPLQSDHVFTSWQRASICVWRNNECDSRPSSQPPWFCTSCKALMLQRGSLRMPADMKNTAVECGKHRPFSQTNRGDRRREGPWRSSANRSPSTPPSCPTLQRTPHINGRQWLSVQRGHRGLLYATIVLLPRVT